jgi:hypothetical protein
MDRATVRSNPGGDHRSLQAIVRSRENEKKVLELCLRGATESQAADAVGLSESGVSRAPASACRVSSRKSHAALLARCFAVVFGIRLENIDARRSLGLV